MAKGLIDCPHCGKRTFAGGKFCSDCGRELPAAATSAEQKPAKAAEKPKPRFFMAEPTVCELADGSREVSTVVSDQTNCQPAAGAFVQLAGDGPQRTKAVEADGSVTFTVAPFKGKKKDVTLTLASDASVRCVVPIKGKKPEVKPTPSELRGSFWRMVAHHATTDDGRR